MKLNRELFVWSHLFRNKALVHRRGLMSNANACLPVFRLSDDLLEIIFLEAASSSSLIKTTDAAMKLSQICRRWRVVALSSGRLWARLSGGPKLFKLILARSLSAPLYLTLDIRHVGKTNLIFGQIDRIVAMSLFVASDIVTTGSQNAPVLRALALDFAPGMRDSAYLVGWNMPKLEKLSLAQTGLTNKDHLLVKTLTALELEAVDCHGAAGSISLLSRLKSLRLAGCLSEEFLRTLRDPICLPALETLDVVDVPELCLGIIRRLQIPSIISLSLDFVARVGPQCFSHELTLGIRRHVSERGGNAGKPTTMHTVAFNNIDGRPSLAYWSALSTDMEPPPDSKPAIQIVFHGEDITGTALEMAAQLALPGVKCLLYMPRENECGDNFFYFCAAEIFYRIEKLVVRQAAYHAAMVLFKLNSDSKPKTCGHLILSSLATLVLADIQPRGDVDFYHAWAQSFVESLQTRHAIGKSIRTLAIEGCSVFRRRDIEAIRPYVDELLWDEQAMD